MTTTFSQFDGPRLLRRDEMAAADQLDRLCFGFLEPAHEHEEEQHDYIQPKRGGIYVMAEAGRLVSKIGVYHARVRMGEAVFPVASIGGVCTHPDFQGRGLATHLLEYCTGRLVEQGAQLMLVSGTLGLYTRQGNVFHGCYQYFNLRPGEGHAWRPAPADLVLRRMTPRRALLLVPPICARI